MHEHLLFAQVATDDCEKTLHQLAGVTRMQPRRVVEQRLIFRATPPNGQNQVQVGASQGVVTQDLKKTQAMLNGGLYHIQVIGRYDVGLDSTMTGGGGFQEQSIDVVTAMKLSPNWSIEFRDIPEAGASQPVTSRSISTLTIDEGNVIDFVNAFGYEYLSRHVLEGYKFYDQDTTFFLYQTLVTTSKDADRLNDSTSIPSLGDLTPLDPSGSLVLEASVVILDGNNHELRSKATQQLNTVKETFKPNIALQPADRLALDTRVNTLKAS